MKPAYEWSGRKEKHCAVGCHTMGPVLSELCAMKSEEPVTGALPLWVEVYLQPLYALPF